MHLNWLMPLGGDLTGTLPNPRLASSTFGDSVLQNQIFGPKQIAAISIADEQNNVEAGQVFGRHTVSWFPSPPDDSQSIQASRTFGQHQYLPDVRPGSGITVTRDAQGFVIGSTALTVVDDENNILSNRAYSPNRLQVQKTPDDSQVIEAGRIFRERESQLQANVQLSLLTTSQWGIVKCSVNVGETAVIPSGYGAVIPGPFNNLGNVSNSGVMHVL